jgi:hypothetical protein
MSNTLLIILIIAGVAIFLICLNELRSYKRNQKETNIIISEAYNKTYGKEDGHS